MPIETPSPSTLTCIAQVEQTYARLMCIASGAEHLGGKLLYAGELDERGRAFAIAGDIAGAATLGASADAAALRQAQHSGAIDFLVNSLDEALRILKNEIRKHEPVAVAVWTAPAAMLAEMMERGVLPDLLPEQIADPVLRRGSRFLVWPIPAEFAQRPAAFEALLLEHLPVEDLSARRWLRLSPRYLGPQARRLRSLRCDEETALRLIDVLGKPLES